MNTVYNCIPERFIHFFVQSGNYPNKDYLLENFYMISCQVSMIAEICICHARNNCETVLRYKTTLQNSFKNQRLIPLTIGVKKNSGFKSCQVSEVRISFEDQKFCELRYCDRECFRK